jgi:class 3 adenylate cyclase
MSPRTQYTRSGGVHIAYQVFGTGPGDLVYVPGWVSHIEQAWEEPLLARFLSRLGSFARVITFDKRGTGMSDRVPDDKLPTLEDRIDDLRAVMDAAASKRAAIMGVSEGGTLCTIFAATYPDRVAALIMLGSYAKRVWSEDYPWAPTPEARQREYELIEREWGNLMDLEHYVPSKVGDAVFMERLAKYFRMAASPGAAVTILRMNTEIDTRALLPTIRVPTLILHRVGERDVKIEEGRYIAARIPGAKLVELAGDEHIPWVGDQDTLLDEIQEFVTGVRPAPAVDRVLSTIMFTDIVGSTELAARLGDQGWKGLLEQHNALARKELSRFRGREEKMTGDGFFATFDGPARAIRCASSIRDGVRPLGIEIRAGLHTGEIELAHDDVGGIAVHIGARVAALAKPSEVLVSSTVKDLAAGSGLTFADRGAHRLRGVPGQWHLFRVS